MSQIPAHKKREPKDLKQLSFEQLLELVVEQQQLIEQLLEEIARLKLGLKPNSQTSSIPPSADLIQKSEKPKSEEEEAKPKRKPGGQAGHQGKTRKGFGRVDRYSIVRPQECPYCGSTSFPEKPVRVSCQQVAQLVERPIEIVEYQYHTCACAHCHQYVKAASAAGVVPGQDLGISLQAMLAWMGNLGNLSYEKQQEGLREFAGVEIGVGTLCATNRRVAKAVAQPMTQLWQWAQQQPHLHVDETPWCVAGVKEWLWTVAGAKFSLFHAADTRGRVELEQILGDQFAGVLSSDDYSVYNGYPVAHQQKCLAHLRRHFKKVIRLGHGNNPQLGKAFIDLIDEAFTTHEQWRETQDGAAYRSWAAQFKLKLSNCLKQWSSSAGAAAGVLLRSLIHKAAQWWYFLDHPQVPPDNNRAERSLRPAVIKRKVCGGSRSMERFRDTADLLGVIQTCRLQGRSAVAFFRDALCATVFSHLPPPSLIPPS
jgi:transposase